MNRKNSRDITKTRLTTKTQHIGRLFTPRSVQLVARMINLVRNSQHDQIMHGTLFNLFEYSRFRATSCTLRFTNYELKRKLISQFD